MKDYIIKSNNFKEIAVLTRKRLDYNNYEITGYSKEKLNKGDRIFTNGKQYYLVNKEIERRDAKGNWPDGDNKDNWYKANTTLVNIT